MAALELRQPLCRIWDDGQMDGVQVGAPLLEPVRVPFKVDRDVGRVAVEQKRAAPDHDFGRVVGSRQRLTGEDPTVVRRCYCLAKWRVGVLEPKDDGILGRRLDLARVHKTAEDAAVGVTCYRK